MASEFNNYPIRRPSPAFFGKLTVSEKVAWLLFLGTTIQAAFQHPDITLVIGERSKVFTGLLCALSFTAAVWSLKGSKAGGVSEVAICIILTGLIFLSSFLSITPESSLYRAFVVTASALGGFWCARILLRDVERKIFFTWFCLGILCVILVITPVCMYFTNTAYRFVDVNPHPPASRILLLWFAPFVLIFAGDTKLKVFGWITFLSSYFFFYYSQLRSAFLIPVLLSVAAFFTGAMRLRSMAMILALLVVAAVPFFYGLPESKIGLQYEPAYYRVENYPFSLHIAMKHPFLGIGLRAPRTEFLSDYETKYSLAPREQFVDSVTRIVSSENIFLTFMTEVGFPFVIIYTLSVFALLTRLWKATKAPYAGDFPLFAILFPLIAGLLHFQVFDGLLHPQVSWFFHILLGMIPFGASAEVESAVSES